MRERYLEAFDAMRIDCLNGDKIQDRQGRARRLTRSQHLLDAGRSGGHSGGHGHCDAGAQTGACPRRGSRLSPSLGPIQERATAGILPEAEPDALYESVVPVRPLGLPFVPIEVSEGWFGWPALPDLFPTSFPGVKTSRDSFLVDTDLERLKIRITDYFDPSLSHEEVARRYPCVMQTTGRFDARATRDALLARGGPNESGFIPYAYRPFDNRWLYWEGETKLLR